MAYAYTICHMFICRIHISKRLLVHIIQVEWRSTFSQDHLPPRHTHQALIEASSKSPMRPGSGYQGSVGCSHTPLSLSLSLWYIYIYSAGNCKACGTSAGKTFLEGENPARWYIYIYDYICIQMIHNKILDLPLPILHQTSAFGFFSPSGHHTTAPTQHPVMDLRVAGKSTCRKGWLNSWPKVKDCSCWGKIAWEWAVQR